MSKVKSVFLIVVLGMVMSVPAEAALSWATGTVSSVGVYPPGTLAAETLFALSPQPSASCPHPANFALSTSTTTDTRLLNNMLAVLLSAKASGATVQVMYDPAGGCDPTGYIAAYAIWVL